MELTPKACYQAVLSHDHRFDGLFFTCVTSTGIYCRPTCMAQVPKEENCRFVQTAAAAEKAGFRPCLRCRPEHAPGKQRELQAPAHQLAEYIGETLLLDETLDKAARRFHLSERHLRRLFVHNFGMEPKQYLTTQRLLFAKQLLQDTSMPITQVAYAAGFGSPGRLTVNMNHSYGFSPAKLRRQHVPNRSKSIRLRADYRPPFNWEALLQFLKERATIAERIENGVYYRDVGDHTIAVSNVAGKNYLSIELAAELSRQSYSLLRKVRHLFDLDANPAVIEQALSADPLLEELIKKYPGVRVPGCWDNFEMVLRVIVGQQVSVAGATTIMRRLAENIGIAPEQIAHSSPAAIATLCMPLKRATTIWHVGCLAQTSTLRLNELDPKIFYKQLVAIPGIGPWSAEYLQMRILHWPDVLPAGDRGLQKALVPGHQQTEAQVRIRGIAWQPWRSYATMLLWKSLENKGG